MRKFLYKALDVLEFLALLIVSYFGAKYVFVAGPVFFGNLWGILIPVAVVLLYLGFFFKKREDDEI